MTNETNAETRNFAWNKMNSGALSVCVFPLVFSAEDLPVLWHDAPSWR